jgi:hypothetical protein
MLPAVRVRALQAAVSIVVTIMSVSFRICEHVHQTSKLIGRGILAFHQKVAVFI